MPEIHIENHSELIDTLLDAHIAGELQAVIATLHSEHEDAKLLARDTHILQRALQPSDDWDVRFCKAERQALGYDLARRIYPELAKTGARLKAATFMTSCLDLAEDRHSSRAKDE